jgi:hypothetical protein
LSTENDAGGANQRFGTTGQAPVERRLEIVARTDRHVLDLNAIWPGRIFDLVKIVS